MAPAPPNRSGRPRRRRKPDRIAYYAHNILRDIAPQILFRNRLNDELKRVLEFETDHISARLNYYNKLEPGTELGPDASPISRISLEHSFYYYDLKEHARYFPRRFLLHYLFGDVTTVPDTPTFVKSRPIAGDNRNSVIVNLDKLRHFHIPADTIPFEDKQPKAVWRGSDHNPRRVALVSRVHGRSRFDVGYTNVADDHPQRASFLSPEDQMAFRYILSVEGNDVATNLKWILASNSLCLMPRPRFETWFMEGRLEADRHYVEIEDDFSDLDDKIRHFEAHPDEARAIIREANAHVAGFFHPKREKALSLLVLHKYFVMTGQMDLNADLAGLLKP